MVTFQNPTAKTSGQKHLRKAFTELQGWPYPNPGDMALGGTEVRDSSFCEHTEGRFRNPGGEAGRDLEERKGLPGAPLAQVSTPLRPSSEEQSPHKQAWISGFFYLFLPSRHVHSSPGQGLSLPSTFIFLTKTTQGVSQFWNYLVCIQSLKVISVKGHTA